VEWVRGSCLIFGKILLVLETEMKEKPPLLTFLIKMEEKSARMEKKKTINQAEDEGGGSS